MSQLLEEREYYKPFVYPWAFEFYKKQQQMERINTDTNGVTNINSWSYLLLLQRVLELRFVLFLGSADADHPGLEEVRRPVPLVSRGEPRNESLQRRAVQT